MTQIKSTAPGPGDFTPTSSRQNTVLRLISAAVLIPVTIGAVYIGGWAFSALVILAALLMAYEWLRLLGDAIRSAYGGLLFATVICAPLFSHFGLYAAALGLISGAAFLPLAMERRISTPVLWRAFGVVYITIALVALLWLRAQPNGMALVVLLLFCVWATDTGAFIFGLLIGGPKLSPSVSPSKTWAGLIGGAISASLTSVGVDFYFFDGFRPLVYVLIGGSIAVVGQIGDVVESAIKRHFGIKDISGIIPGHGGVLDRVDGLIFATIAMAISIIGVHTIRAFGGA